MNSKKYTEIKQLFESNANEENAEKMSAYMRDKFAYYGIKTPERRKIYKGLIKTDKKDGVIDWDFLDECYGDDHREFQYLVADYLGEFQNVLKYGDIPKILEYVKDKQWWDTIDGFDRIIGNIGLEDERVDELMLQWSTDEDMWLRRIAIDHQLLRNEKTNTQLLAEIIENNFGSDEFFINKAIGWSLREYSKTDADWVRRFIDKNREKMAKLSIREGSKYI